MKENQENVGHYSVIPVTVLYNKELKANEKLLYTINNGCQYQSKKGKTIHQKVEDNVIRNNIKNNNKVKKKIISNYTNPREYSEKFLNSLYANFNM